MPAKRSQQSQSSLNLPDHSPNSSASGLFNFPRSASPSGLSGFGLLSKPSKWFKSPGSGRNISGTAEPRSSTGSVTRKPKISHPTDPRPILPTMGSDNYIGSASRSVYDLSLQKPGTLEPVPSLPATPSSSRSLTPSKSGTGDLRSISRRAWSKSADDLSNISGPERSKSPSLAPLDTELHSKISKYRANRSDSANSSVTPTTPPSNNRQRKVDFPVATQNLSSSPPNRNFLSTSGSAPHNLSPLQQTPPHTHSRSHSFTPRLASKFAPPKLALVPPSPTRKVSLSSASDRDLTTPSSASRSAFPFGLGSSSKPNTPVTSVHPPPPTKSYSLPLPTSGSLSPLLDPPKIIEPSDANESRESRRTSQIIHQSGFINRLGSFNPATINQHGNHAGALSKGWKPFKLILKGTKLYFYKPPNDRAGAVKELFPTELVAAFEEAGLDADGADETPEVSPHRGGRDDRRRRAYWGRRTHPELIRAESDEQEILRGTLPALVHEAVFGTTFASPEDEEPLSSTRDIKWRHFASAILLGLPPVVGQGNFETEFLRCGDYLIAGAPGCRKKEQEEKVMMLADEYLMFHERPADEEAWERWREETIPSFPSWKERQAVSTSQIGGMPSSSSTQAMFVPTPTLGGEFLSPHLGTLSPRPDQSQSCQSIFDALDSPRLVSSPTSAKGAPQQNQHKAMVWAALDRDGFTKEVLVRMDPHLIASSLKVFNRDLWEKTPENLSPSSFLGSEGEDAEGEEFQGFFGTEAHPHWLTKTVLLQIFGQDTPFTSSSQGRGGNTLEDRPVTKSSSRAEVIMAWIRIGELSRQLGDECSWMAICAALFSRPVARLDRVWKRLDSVALTIAESWVYPGPEGGPATAGEPKQTPWGGIAKEKLRECFDQVKESDTGKGWVVKPLFEAKEVWGGLQASFALCPRKTDWGRSDRGRGMEEGESVSRMVTLWQTLHQNKGNNGSGLALKITRIDQFMSLSFATEPRRRGTFEPYFWVPAPPGQQQTHPLLALMMPEPLPSIVLIDRAEVIRGRTESSNNAAQEVAAARELLLQPNPPRSKRSSGDPVWDTSIGVPGDMGGIEITVFDGELIVTVQSFSESPSRSTSRPPSSVVEGNGVEKTFSRSPSIRVRRAGGKGLDRKPSTVNRRNSLPSVPSNPEELVPSQSSFERPLRVRVKAGTLERLVDVLLHGLQGVSVAFSDDNGEMPLRDGKHRDLKVDHLDFSTVWWNSFRSFVTPLVFFELLRKRYQQANNGSSLASIKDRIEILELLQEWIQKGSGGEDALDDAQLYDTLKAFILELMREEGFSGPQRDSTDVKIREAWKSLGRTKDSLTTLFATHTKRPPIKKPNSDFHEVAGEGYSRNVNSDTPDIDRLSPEELVNAIDAMINAAFRNVTEDDILVASDLLELQSTDRTGWFVAREHITSGDEIEVQTFHSLVCEVESTSLIPGSVQDSLYSLFPASVRSCIKAFAILRKWLISKIAFPKLGIRPRQSRLERLLQALEISRIRNSDSTSSTPISEKPCVRSFVEAVLTSALLSPESRAYSRAWQNVSNSRRTTADSFSALLDSSNAQTSTGDSLLVDIGWLFERILEVIVMPNVIPQPAEEGQGLVNFEKRRFLCHLAANAASLGPATRKRRRQVGINDLARLGKIEQEASYLQFDHRLIREDATREAGSDGIHPTKRIPRPFNLLVLAQQEKYKRDKYARDRLSKEKKQEQHRYEKREDYLNKAMHNSKPSLGVSKAHRNKKSMSSAFFQFMRPISSAFTSETAIPSGQKRTAEELEFTPTGKPALVLSLADCRVAQFINNERSFTFQLDTEDGGHYLLQAMGKKDMTKWMNKISQVSKAAAKRRLTYLGNNANLAEQLAGLDLNTRDHALFGIDLKVLIQREFGDNPPPGAVPSMLEICFREVESRGLPEVGIYRIAGSTLEINGIKDALNHGRTPIDGNTDIYAICDVIKYFFRNLPEPVVPSNVYFAFIDSAKIESLEPRLANIRRLLRELPAANFDLLKRLFEHLDKVTDYEELNQMTSHSLSIVIGPNILRAPRDDFAVTMSNMGQAHSVTRAMISHCHVLFGEADIEAENEDGDEYDEQYDDDTIPEGSVEEGDDGMTTPAFNVIPASTEGHSDEGRPGY
ncbi:hypothetical protein BJ322DRAFT_1109900 [Thelephora terrestris]|uniref:Uncharacterized protein n=1 Tax=Thelephora terrestris TaxID=56493 RepID=A0A9P6HCU9_9AGAM|nr:hypothetical protein BJ322DRAFT_1109900 [Thelephora terrestris]